MNTTSDLLHRIALTLVKGIGNKIGREMISAIDDLSPLFTEKKIVLEKTFGIPKRLIDEIQRPEVLQRAEQEVAFIEKNNIKVYFIGDDDYPARLKECVDAPLLFYFKGNAGLDAKKIISIVGTRNATSYGKSLIEELVAGIAKTFPDALIVSGLAYGVDIAAHKAALKENLPTVAVLAHGLDRLYPPSHRKTAVEMLDNGGLLTEHISLTNPDKPNFVKRNRIVAGMADCTVVVESAEKGGALITAHIAGSYNRDVFAYPGKTTDKYSQGCNRLIKNRAASMITCAEDLFHEMNWMQSKPQAPVQQQLFINLTGDEQKLVDRLALSDALQLNDLCNETEMPISKLSPLLFDLEMRGIIRCMPGGLYCLA
jgi:DNA protecting protein DprA